MKDTLLVPALYLLFLLLTGFIFIFVFFLFLAVSGYNPASGIPWKDILVSLPAWFHRIMPAIISFSVLLLSIRIRRRQGPRFFSQAVLAATAFALLFVLSGLLPPDAEETGPVGPAVVIPDQISIFDGTIVYIEEQEEQRLYNLYVKDLSNPEGTFARHPSALITQSGIEDPEGNTLASFSTANPVFSRLFAPPDILATFFNDVGIAAGRLSEASSGGGMFRILIFAAFILFCLAIQTAGRVSRWPLINICLALTFYRGFFYIYRITADRDVLDFLGETLPAGLVRALPETILLSIALVLFLITLLKAGKGAAA